MRIIIYTGKGGVGKTTVAAATAHRCARLGYRTLISSTDAAHSLADSLAARLWPEPVAIADNLWAEEIDALHEMEKHWSTIQDHLRAVLAWGGQQGIAAEELTVAPGSEELFSLLKIKRHHDEGQFDVLIVDAAPTGETLRLLSMPDVMRWWVEKLFPTVRNLMKVARPLVGRVTSLPMPSDAVYESLAQMIDRINAVREIVADPEQTSVRIVLNLEKMVIREAQRNLAYLNLFGYNVDAVIANRLLPKGVPEWLGDWRQLQESYRAQVQEEFAPLPVLEAPLFEREIVGAALLNRLGDTLYGDQDPTRFYYRGQTQTITPQSNGYLLELQLPFMADSPVDVAQTGDELTVHLGWHKRHLVLPQTLARLNATGASFRQGVLRVTFERV